MISKIRILLENESIKQQVEKLIQKYGLVSASKAVGGLKKLYDITHHESSGDRYEDFNNFITNRVFQENDFPSSDDINLKINFKILKSMVINIDGDKGLDLDCVVLNGSYFDTYENFTIHFSTGDLPMDDFSEYFEFKDYIESEISSFIMNLSLEFGIKLSFINVSW